MLCHHFLDAIFFRAPSINESPFVVCSLTHQARVHTQRKDNTKCPQINALADLLNFFPSLPSVVWWPPGDPVVLTGGGGHLSRCHLGPSFTRRGRAPPPRGPAVADMAAAAGQTNGHIMFAFWHGSHTGKFRNCKSMRAQTLHIKRRESHFSGVWRWCVRATGVTPFSRVGCGVWENIGGVCTDVLRP